MVPYGTIMVPYGTIWYWDITEPEHGHLWKNTYFLTDLDFHDIYPACQLVLFRHEYVYQKFEYIVFLCYKVWLKPRWYKNIKRSLGAILQYLPSSEPHVVHGACCFTMPHLDSGFASSGVQMVKIHGALQQCPHDDTVPYLAQPARRPDRAWSHVQHPRGGEIG